MRDFYEEAQCISDALNAEGQPQAAKYLMEAMDGFTATEILMSMKFRALEILVQQPKLSNETVETLTRLASGIEHALR